jgi:hypothetical protein
LRASLPSSAIEIFGLTGRPIEKLITGASAKASCRAGSGGYHRHMHGSVIAIAFGGDAALAGVVASSGG